MTSIPGGRILCFFFFVTIAGLALLNMGCAKEPGKSANGGVETLWIEGPQGKLRVEDGGSGGIPVVFVHGLAGNRGTWTAQLANVRSSRRAVALDLHGMGESDPSPTNLYTIESFAEDVATVVTSLKLGRVILVGHSMGGDVILAFAKAHPELTAALLFDDPAGDLTGFPKEAVEEQWLKKMAPDSYDTFRETWFGEMLKAARPEVRDQVMTTMRKTPQIVVASAARSLAGFDPKPILKGFPGPMLTVVTPENKLPHSLQNVVNNLPSKEITGVSHWIMMDKPEEFNTIMEAFLQTVK